jgi:hypothetical protein
MRVKNKTDHGVFVANYGVVPAGEEATVQESESAKSLVKSGVLSEVKTSSSGSSSSGSASTSKPDDKKEGDAG